MSAGRRLLQQLTSVYPAGLLGVPPGLTGHAALGITAIHGVPRPRAWDALVSARAPDLPGEEVTFVVLADGTVIVDQDVPDGSLAVVADAIEQTLLPPYRAAAVRADGDVWSAVAQSILLAELRDLDGDVVDLTVVGGARSLTIEDEPTIRPLRELDELAEGRGDVVLHAERIDGDLFAVERFEL